MRALDGISLTVAAGQVCAVAGRNGAGKSTLFRVLTGLVTPTKGWARVCGHDVVAGGREVRRLIGFVPGDDRSLTLQLTPREILTVRARLHGLSGPGLRARVDDVLALVDLVGESSRMGFALSSGMRARLQLACALLHQPPVLVLDEPTASIDPVAASSLLETIRQLAREQRLAVLLSTHRADEIEALSDNVALLDRGRLVHIGNLDELRVRHEAPVVELTFDRPEAAVRAANGLRALAGVDLVSVDGARLEVTTALTLGRVLSALDGALGSVDAVQRRRLPVRTLLAEVLRGEEAPAWEG